MDIVLKYSLHVGHGVRPFLVVRHLEGERRPYVEPETFPTSHTDPKALGECPPWPIPLSQVDNLVLVPSYHRILRISQSPPSTWVGFLFSLGSGK
jgi:hypothetical protein